MAIRQGEIIRSATSTRGAEDATDPRVVVVGAGFGGLACVGALGGKPVRVTWIDRRNHHLFQPLLYQVATAVLSPADIAAPLRALSRRHRNIDVVLDEVVDIDPAARLVVTREERIRYDHLVVATGAETSYFGNEQWRDIAYGLKSLEEATALRRRILLALERADREADEDAKRRLSTFVLIGAGPTGVEMAGAIASVLKPMLSRDYRHLDPTKLSIVLIEAMDQVLPGFPADLAAFTQDKLERMGVTVRVGRMVDDIDEQGCVASGERFAAGTVIWTAGVKATPVAQWLKVEGDKKGRVEVGRDLSVPGHPEIAVIGDAAVAMDEEGHPYPGLAAVAKQQGLFVAHRVLAQTGGATVPAAFHYRDWGILATLGYSSAVGDLHRFHVKGLVGWVVWAMVHLWYLIGFRNRVSVLVNWIWGYLSYRPGARLITGGIEAPPRADAALEKSRVSSG